MQVHSYDSYVEVICAPPAIKLRGLCLLENLCFSGSQQIFMAQEYVLYDMLNGKNSSVVNSSFFFFPQISKEAVFETYCLY